jgi:hypothetical protein
MPTRFIMLSGLLFVATAGCADSERAKRDGSTTGSGGSAGNGKGGSVSGGSTTGGAAGEDGATGGGARGASGTSGGGDTSSGGTAGASDGGEAASGTAGAAGSGGTTSTGGTGGAPAVPGCTPGTRGGTPDVCGFEITCALSATIPTVGVIDWSTDLEGLSAARIEFTLNDPKTSEINLGSGGPIDVTGSSHRALMLGLKPQRTYGYRIVATAGDTICTSPDGTLTTGSAEGAPIVTQTNENAALRANGFIVTSSGYAGSGRKAFIIDADGHPVWWADSPLDCSRALMDWEGATMWMVATNSAGIASGEVRRTGMDGMGAENDIEGLGTAHHDFAVAPGGIVAFLLGTDASGVSNLVERSPDGTLRTVATLDGTVFKTRTAGTWHANSIQYHPTDESYTVGDRNAHAYVKLTRQGELVWQFGPDCEGAPAPKCASAGAQGDHGHHVLDNGNFLSFAASSPSSVVYEHRLTETASSLSANLVWSYSAPDRFSVVLGDVQRLPNGNTLVVYSTTGWMHEVSEAGELVRIIRVHSATTANGTFGYANFRETLYGPPIR